MIADKNCTTFVFMFFFHEKIYNLLIFLLFLPVATFSFIFINFPSTFYKIIIWTYNSPLKPCSFNRKLNFDFFCLILISLSHGKRCFMKILYKPSFGAITHLWNPVHSIENWILICSVLFPYFYLTGNVVSCPVNFFNIFDIF